MSQGDISHDHGGSISNGNIGSTEMMATHMSFYWGKHALILFSGWPNNSLGMYILALLFVILLAIAIEVLSVSPTKPSSSSSSSRINNLVLTFVQASVYAVRMGFAYLVMLSVMSYNLGIFIAAVAGHAVGFFIVKARATAAVRTDYVGSITTPRV